MFFLVRHAIIDTLLDAVANNVCGKHILTVDPRRSSGRSTVARLCNEAGRVHRPVLVHDLIIPTFGGGIELLAATLDRISAEGQLPVVILQDYSRAHALAHERLYALAEAPATRALFVYVETESL